MAFEARIAARGGVRVVCGNGNAAALAEAVAHAIGDDCRGLISFGVAGGLSPQLQAGSCVVGSTILDGTSQFATDRDWSQNLLRAIPGAIHGGIAGVADPIVHAEAKRALHASTGAVAVDMESHAVARVAAARGLPMAAVRVVIDSASSPLPSSALAAMRPDGTVDVVALIRALAKAPGEAPMLLRTARDALTAGLSLRRCRRRLGASFELPDSTEARAPNFLPSSAAETDMRIPA
jgi:hopanoid-associated phosphorylase